MEAVQSEKMFDCKCFTARLIAAKFLCERLRMSSGVAYAPCDDKKEEVMDGFWRELVPARATEVVDPERRLCVTGELMGGDGLLGVDDRTHGLSAAAGPGVANTYFKHKDVR